MTSKTKTNKAKPAGKRTSDQVIGKGWPDVADNIVNKTYSLLASGNLLGLGIIFFVGLVMLVTYRMPAEQIPWLIAGIVAHFLKCSWITGLLVLYAFVATVIFLSRDRSLREEIHRLTEIRKELTYGLENATLKHLSEHPESSGYSILE
ncbi:MAG: hypothetical protein HQL07_06590 [Nitrospirae bacterium]|nr:hypothetical protein [Magnetococcales bacterium]HAT51386.1 hypothetical protein [Alphaproteobacteria bacterium]